jgi:nucleolar protein 9
LIDQHNTLSESQYGKYFARKLNLPLLQRRPQEWKELQLGVVHHFHGSRLQDKGGATQGFMASRQQDDKTSSAVSSEKPSKKRKQKADDETAVIDDLFADVTEKKVKRLKA